MSEELKPASHEQPLDDPAGSALSLSRRRLLKILATSGGALAGSSLLPEAWVKPVVEVGYLPAHAQTSPTPIALLADVYVTNTGSDNVSVINTASTSVVATIGVGSEPVGVAVNRAGTRAYVTNFGSDTVSVIDTGSNSVVVTIGVGTNPAGVAVNSAGTRTYVTNRGSDNVSVIDRGTNSVVATITVGTSPGGVAAR